MLWLAARDYRLALDPARGGSIARFTWRGEPLMRATCGPSILDTACFPLVPFSNRIAFGRFRDGERTVLLSPNFPGAEHPHPLHGFGWLRAWEVGTHMPDRAILRHRHAADEWPWDYVAEQSFVLSETGLAHGLSLRNEGPGSMPAGLGFHPYFPCTAGTRYRGLHRGEWQTDEDGLPLTLNACDIAIDWWDGRPVRTRTVDTVYAGRSGPLAICWPERGLKLAIAPSDGLTCTVVYTPSGADFFCVEPVTHATDAINRGGADGMARLPQGETLIAELRYRAMAFAAT